MPGKDLTPKQALWLGFYLVLGNATLAAKKAGYSEKTARQQGAENCSSSRSRSDGGAAFPALTPCGMRRVVSPWRTASTGQSRNRSS